ncbi:hypothetical protein ACHAWO_010327 [Cyclotella atomus]|uniref:HSF-type DNA-binding domain-containing protein n=1 Tax=Cyclotella atomus TaxID=382360 RepID=A0ABD3PIW5_9STRA
MPRSLSQPAVSISMPSSDQLMNNYMNALTGNVPARRASAPVMTWSSPDSHPSDDVFDDEELLLGDEDLMLPAAVYSGDNYAGSSSHKFADATVVTSTSSDTGSNEPLPTIITTSKGGRRSASERRHSLPSSVILSADSKIGTALTQPVPEFLCYLFTMLRDENLRDVISWEVPTINETDAMGGGIKGIGKIVCHQPDVLQESVLGKYYRHSKYASFQRQLNYFGFKKRLHGGKKGKLSPCSYVHEGLDANVESLLGLKRRPPLKKRLSMELDSTSVSSIDEEEKVVERPKKRRGSLKSGRKTKSSVSDGDKKPSARQAEPIAVQAEEYNAPAVANSVAAPFAPRPIQVPSIVTQRLMANPAPASATLAQLLSTALPPTDVLFDDNFDDDFDAAANANPEDASGFYVNDQGRCLSQNSLVNLAMFY